MIPYTRHTIEQDDIDAVSKALADGDLATGRIVREYEDAFASYHGYAYGVAVNSGTSALWCAYKALGLKRGDEVITSPLTFVATANMIVAVGARPVFADVDAHTFNITYDTTSKRLTARTKAIVPVDLGGQLANIQYPTEQDIPGLRRVEQTHARHSFDIPIIVDATHSTGIKSAGGLIRCYSTHAAKNMTTCEGGIAITNDSELVGRMRWLRNHGISSEARNRQTHKYSMEMFGFNFRMPDPLAALGLSQLSKLAEFNRKREFIRDQYDVAFRGEPGIILRKCGVSSNHLYVVLLDLDVLRCDRDQVYRKLRDANVGANVHYRPVYLFRPYRRMGFQPGLCPNAEWVYERALTLPLYPSMEEWKVEYVISSVKSTVRMHLK